MQPLLQNELAEVLLLCPKASPAGFLRQRTRHMLPVDMPL